MDNMDECDEDATRIDNFVFVDSSVPSREPEMPQNFRVPPLKGTNVFEISVDELQHHYSTLAFSAEDYTQSCLDRIQATNPYLEAVIETNPDALHIARALDQERKIGKIRGVLHGVPVLVKDVGAAFFHESHDHFSLRLGYQGGPDATDTGIKTPSRLGVDIMC